MGNDIIQAKYDELEAIARRFGQQAQRIGELRSQVQRSAQPLEQGGWQGRGSAAFFRELNGQLIPATQRLRLALDEARSVTLEINELMRRAEQEASAPFRGAATAGPSATLGGAAGLTPGAAMLPAGFGSPLAGAAQGGMFGQGGGVGDWTAAPFVAGGSVLGPVPVPVLGPRGIVPGGYSNAGKRLWLYIGGSGTDTIFSVHPYAGGWRAPKGKLPRPLVRLDYGPVAPGEAFLPNRARVTVPTQPNFFHWNQAGNMGQVNRPLFHSIGAPIAQNHQLLTNNPVPRPNVAGAKPGATFIKGASKGLFVVGAGVDIYNIATADDKVKEGSKVAGGWVGGWAGAKGGAAVGAGIGTFFGPGVGTAVGGVVGGVVGGIGGYIAGSEVGEFIYDIFD